MTTYSFSTPRSADFRSYRWPLLKAAILVGALALPGALFSQGFVSSGSASNANGFHPTATSNGKPEPAPRHIDTRVHDGILTVDGLVAKVDLNYPVDAPFTYFFVPGVGTAIVALDHFPNSTPQKNAFNGNTLTIMAGGHEIQLTNGGPLLKEKGKDEAWVAFDPDYNRASRMPMMGYGEALRAPYQWPGAKPETTQSTALAPPVPKSLQPKMEVSSSYSVTVAPAAKSNP
ncbi:hypothetical protein SAMN05421770_107144 [Granulicella rosea]|uniref:Uncharacterized protein n=1 Tax=Granulicella rosea TaxID=474952 RepID=A0A239LP98_9BACT|nr:hypothetical protein [Granulicella rosea]SNT31708.1 hypothetical protein SAMN05421770_107144 [Granulicella rosea]